eukprot:m.9102 g.9102  ORF g.9102 m.9102 type:complete len:119 (+) comp9360_c0_seq1:73-429(+)
MTLRQRHHNLQARLQAEQTANQQPSFETSEPSTSTSADTNGRAREARPPLPLWLTDIIRGVILVLVFSLLYLPTQWFILDPMRGVSHRSPADMAQQVLEKACPPGVDCSHGDLRLDAL